MVFLGVAIAIGAVTFATLMGGWTSPRGMRVAGLDTTGIALAVAAVGAAVFFFGPLFGVALTLSVAIHEFGHVAAFRVCGHTDARFRLIPLLGGVAISNRVPATQENDFFITVMGPAICIAPMLLAFAVAALLWDTAPEAANFLHVFGIVTGALNFFNLLPFWPLDGGRCVRIMAYAVWPPAGLIVATVMSALLVVTAIAMKSLILFFFALMGAQSLFSKAQLQDVQRPMTRPRATLALGAYLATTATFAVGGLPILLRWL